MQRIGDCETVRPMKQSRYSWLSGGYMVVMYFQWGKTGNLVLLSHIWPWRSRSIALTTKGTLFKVFCTAGPNLVILAWMGGELCCGQAQNGVNLDFQVKFDLEGQGRSVHITIGTLTKVFGIFGPNLVILAWTGPQSSRGQASNWHTERQTDTHTHRRRQRQIPDGQNWPRV